MNPLAFFPPPARTLSRQGGPPPSSSSSSSSSTSHSHSNSMSSSSRPRTPSTTQNLHKQTHHKSSLNTSSTSNSTTPSGSKDTSPSGSTIYLSQSNYNPNDPDALPPQTNQNHHSTKRDKSTRTTSSSGRDKQSAAPTSTSPSGSTTPDLSSSVSSLNSHNTLIQNDPIGVANLPVDSSSSSSSSVSTSNSASTAKGSGSSPSNKLPPGLNFDLVRSNEVSQAYILEKTSYPPEDAASLEKLKYRQSNAPHLFLGAYLATAPPKVAGPLTVGSFSSAPRKLIGYMCATAAPALTLRSMSVHCAEEGTPLVCIHSVVVAKEWRHRGVASVMLKEFHRRIKNAEEGGKNKRPNSSGSGASASFGAFTPSTTNPGASTPNTSSAIPTTGSSSSSSPTSTLSNSIPAFLSKNKDKNASKDIARGYEAFALLAHEELTGLYEKAGFRIQGHSHIQYGSGGWLEMRKDIIEKDSKMEELRQKDLEEERRKDREEGKLKMEQSKKEREKEREDKRKASLLLNTSNINRSNGFSSGNESDGGSASEPQNQVTSPISMDDPQDASTSSMTPTPSPFPPGITQESLLNALRSSSFLKSGGSNPSQPYTQVLGATLAAKTPAEDSFAALEARLVNGQTGTNLAELYCPMESCGSILLKKGSSSWTLCESGPLLDPKLNLNLPEDKNPRPPSGPSQSALPIPRADSIDKSPRALSSVDNLSGAGPLRGFWSVNSPMSFENVGFSKDLEWFPPWVQSATSVEHGGAGEGPSNQGPSGSNPDVNAITPVDDGQATQQTKDSDGKPKREKPVRKGTWRERVRERSFTGILSSPESESGPSSKKEKEKASPPTTENDEASGSYNEPPTLALPSSKNRDNPLLVKFITCGECDCGPLGFTFIPKSLANGGLANQVGKDIDSANAGNGRDRTVGQQELLVAADRVRYRFLKN